MILTRIDLLVLFNKKFNVIWQLYVRRVSVGSASDSRGDNSSGCSDGDGLEEVTPGT